jgi:hypothetical protein
MSTENVHQNLSPRRGWELPNTSTTSITTSTSTTTAAPVRPSYGSGAPTPALRGGVLGQVTTVTSGSKTVNNAPEAFVVLRLERHDPHAGRTSILDVRLDGDDSIGFASTGDWIEAAGKRKSSHLRAGQAINHTTGAAYKRGAAQRHRTLVAAIVFLTVAALMVIGFVIAVQKNDERFHRQIQKDEQKIKLQSHNSAQTFGREVGQYEQTVQQRCLASGLPHSLCTQLR